MIRFYNTDLKEMRPKAVRENVEYSIDRLREALDEAVAFRDAIEENSVADRMMYLSFDPDHYVPEIVTAKKIKT